MTAAEMHALEKEALHDRFLAEALEGIDHTGRESFLFDLQQLNTSIRHRTRHKKGRIIKFSAWTVGIAATLLLIAVSSVFVFIRVSEEQRKSLAMNEKAQGVADEKTQPVAPAPDSEKSGSENAIDPEEKSKKESLSEPEKSAESSKPTAGVTREEEVTEAEATEDAVAGQNQNDEADLDRDEPPVTIAGDEKTKDQEDERSRASGLTSGPMETAHVYGYVTSTETDKPVPGVNVVVKGTNVGTVTDDQGNFDLDVTDEKSVLEFSSIGLATLERKAEDKKKMSVEMSPDPAQLSEVVVTGESQAKRDKSISASRLAEPKGGRDVFKKYLEQKMQYPSKALQNKIEGRVTVQFTVGPNGNLSDFRVLKGIGFGCDDELIRLIKEGPAWTPSIENDQAVEDKVKVRLKFTLPK